MTLQRQLVFFNICGVLVPDSETLESVLPLWTINAIPNQHREFIFKFFNNKLRINTRTFHFGGSTRFCTFCSRVGNPNTGKTFEHLFLTCPITNVVHEQLDEAVFRSRHVSLLNKKLNWLGCQKSDNNIISLRLFRLTIQFFIWKGKLKKTIPNANYVLGESIQLLDAACCLDFNIHFSRTNLESAFFRTWDTWVARGRIHDGLPGEADGGAEEA